MKAMNFFKSVLSAMLMSAMTLTVKADVAVNSENFPDKSFEYTIRESIRAALIGGYESEDLVLTDEQVAKLKRYYTTSTGFVSSQGIHLLTSLEEFLLQNNTDWYSDSPQVTRQCDIHLDLSQCYNLKDVTILKNYIYYYLPDHEFEFEDCSRLFGLSSTRGVVLDEDKSYDLSLFLSYDFDHERVRNLIGAEIDGNKLKFTHRRAIYEYNCSKTAERWLKFCIFTNDLSLPENPEFPQFEIAFDSQSETPEILTDDEGKDYVIIKAARFKENIQQGNDLEIHNLKHFQQWPIGLEIFYLNYGDFSERIAMTEDLFSYDEISDEGYYKVYFPKIDGYKYNPEKSYPISFFFQFNMPGIDRREDHDPNRFGIHSNILNIPAKGSVNSIKADQYDLPTEYYTLQGIKLHRKPTDPGIYIMRNGSETKKVVIK